jgi:GT2 family glycosyltransferase
MKTTAPITVIIPTYNRGMKVRCVLEKVRLCDPAPVATIIHIDQSDGRLEAELKKQFPDVDILTSSMQRGPGGGRHRCLLASKTPFAVSFDDDSYPVDPDFFCRVERLFAEHPRAGIFGARIWQRNEPPKPRDDSLVAVTDYVGCGHAIRLEAYRQIRGYLSRPIAFRMEESDVSLQLIGAGWDIYQTGQLRVLHDTDLSHRESAEVISGAITNVALCAFLHYPLIGWGFGIAQVLNIVVWHLRRGKIRGICSGLIQVPTECYRNRRHRNPISWKLLKNFIRLRRIVDVN